MPPSARRPAARAGDAPDPGRPQESGGAVAPDLRAVDPFLRLLDQRALFLSGPIDGALSDRLVAQLLHLDAEDPTRDITLYINSPGGEVYASLAIYDALQYVHADVRTICCGIAMSGGSVVLCGGAPGKRAALPNSRILIHQPHGGVQGQTADVEIQAREMLWMRERIEELYVEHTGQPRERVHRDVERDRFLSPRDALDYGLIDEIVARRPA
nr:ATP-dependent Clp protease proteolytic subunit [Patulibacter sp. SYSU D01012]